MATKRVKIDQMIYLNSLQNGKQLLSFPTMLRLLEEQDFMRLQIISCLGTTLLEVKKQIGSSPSILKIYLKQNKRQKRENSKEKDSKSLISSVRKI